MARFLSISVEIPRRGSVHHQGGAGTRDLAGAAYGARVNFSAESRSCHSRTQHKPCRPALKLEVLANGPLFGAFRPRAIVNSKAAIRILVWRSCASRERHTVAVAFVRTRAHSRSWSRSAVMGRGDACGIESLSAHDRTVSDGASHVERHSVASRTSAPTPRRAPRGRVWLGSLRAGAHGRNAHARVVALHERRSRH